MLYKLLRTTWSLCLLVSCMYHCDAVPMDRPNQKRGAGRNVPATIELCHFGLSGESSPELFAQHLINCMRALICQEKFMFFLDLSSQCVRRLFGARRFGLNADLVHIDNAYALGGLYEHEREQLRLQIVQLRDQVIDDNGIHERPYYTFTPGGLAFLVKNFVSFQKVSNGEPGMIDQMNELLSSKNIDLHYFGTMLAYRQAIDTIESHDEQFYHLWEEHFSGLLKYFGNCVSYGEAITKCFRATRDFNKSKQELWARKQSCQSQAISFKASQQEEVKGVAAIESVVEAYSFSRNYCNALYELCFQKLTALVANVATVALPQDILRYKDLGAVRDELRSIYSLDQIPPFPKLLKLPLSGAKKCICNHPQLLITKVDAESKVSAALIKEVTSHEVFNSELLRKLDKQYARSKKINSRYSQKSKKRTTQKSACTQRNACKQESSSQLCCQTGSVEKEEASCSQEEAKFVEQYSVPVASVACVHGMEEEKSCSQVINIPSSTPSCLQGVTDPLAVAPCRFASKLIPAPQLKYIKAVSRYADGLVSLRPGGTIDITDPSNEMTLQLFEVDRMLHKELFDGTCKTKKNINVWFEDIEQAMVMQGYFTGSCKSVKQVLSNRGILSAVQRHRFSRLVDNYVTTHGVVSLVPSRRNAQQCDQCVVIPGHVRCNRTRTSSPCLFVYLFDAVTGLCYHRNMQRCSFQDMIAKFCLCSMNILTNLEFPPLS